MSYIQLKGLCKKYPNAARNSVKLNNLNVYGYLLHLLTELPKLGEFPTDEQLDSFMPWAKLPDFCK